MGGTGSGGGNQSYQGNQSYSSEQLDAPDQKNAETNSDGSTRAIDRLDRVKRIQQDFCGDKEEIEFLKKELETFKKYVDVPLMTRRKDCFKENVMDELQEVHLDVQNIESCLLKTINMAEFFI